MEIYGFRTLRLAHQLEGKIYVGRNTEARWKILDHLVLILLWDSGTRLLKGESMLAQIGRRIAILARLHQIGRNVEAERGESRWWRT